VENFNQQLFYSFENFNFCVNKNRKFIITPRLWHVRRFLLWLTAIPTAICSVKNTLTANLSLQGGQRDCTTKGSKQQYLRIGVRSFFRSHHCDSCRTDAISLWLRKTRNILPRATLTCTKWKSPTELSLSRNEGARASGMLVLPLDEIPINILSCTRNYSR
jgi:hypothetical protein